MKKSCLFISLAAFLMGAVTPAAPSSLPLHPKPTADELSTLAEQAYIYGYPLVTMELTRRVLTNVASPTKDRAPMGEFLHMRNYPEPNNKAVTAPNADTLYSSAWLDLKQEPVILSLPDAKDRYYLMPMLSGWTDVFEVPGKRTTGTKAQTYVITGPGWTGTLPKGLKELKSPTSLVWILGRTYCDGTPEDYRAVHALQDQYTLVRLSQYGKSQRVSPGKVDPSVDMKTAVRDQVNRLDAASYFTLLASLLIDNPPADADAPFTAKLTKLGIIPGKTLEFDRLDPAQRTAMQTAPMKGLMAIKDHEAHAGTEVNGWLYSSMTGRYGTDYLQRAFVTAVGLGANRPQDAIYPLSMHDDQGQPLSGKSRYVIHFAKGETPPVNGFWSVTMYDPTYFFVPNPINRFSISARNSLQTNDDGSVDLLIQQASPGEQRQSNWLPAPEGQFLLMLRMYWPREQVINGSWKPPAVKRID